jgi:hypothetical protein
LSLNARRLNRYDALSCKLSGSVLAVVELLR